LHCGNSKSFILSARGPKTLFFWQVSKTGLKRVAGKMGVFCDIFGKTNRFLSIFYLDFAQNSVENTGFS
jgi:hypothetical protein